MDVLIVGAGLSGIGAAHHLKTHCPTKSFTLLEARGSIGGTWDLFRYPGIRSDSDMYTFGYRFRPWLGDKALADGPSILQYIQDTARESGIDQKIRFNHRVTGGSWSSEQGCWTVTAQDTERDEQITFTAGFLWVCSGYYRYDKGYTPDFEGMDDFNGRIVHPQHWPEDLDTEGKHVVVIGSGATAVTLVPALVAQGARVTMVQRSPTYIYNVPAVDRLATRAREVLPTRLAYRFSRWKNVLHNVYTYEFSQRLPAVAKRHILGLAAEQLPEDYPVDVHFNPRYNPWDQRLCAAPDGDFFAVVREGRATIVTDTIERFTPDGLKLGSGATIDDADLIVTATGFTVQVNGGARVVVDGREVVPSETLTYKGMMLAGVPNHAFTVGYTNASWTLKADLVSEYVCRLLNHMDTHGHTRFTVEPDPAVERTPVMDFGAGYVQRALARLPQQGDRWPWRLSMSYPVDVVRLRFGRLEDGVMQFR